MLRDPRCARPICIFTKYTVTQRHRQ